MAAAMSVLAFRQKIAEGIKNTVAYCRIFKVCKLFECCYIISDNIIYSRTQTNENFTDCLSNSHFYCLQYHYFRRWSRERIEECWTCVRHCVRPSVGSRFFDHYLKTSLNSHQTYVHFLVTSLGMIRFWTTLILFHWWPAYSKWINWWHLTLIRIFYH